MATLDEMDEAAETASVALDAILNEEEGSAEDILRWWAEWFPKAGHKRLGRLLAARGKELDG